MELIQAESPELITNNSENDEGVSFANLRVLLADDEALVCDAVRNGLRHRLGCDATVATNGDEVLDLISTHTFDMLITDLKMPGVQALDLVRKVRAHAPDMGIIVMTGFRNEFPYIDVLRAGANDFIHKPFPLEELDAKVQRLAIESVAVRERKRAERKYRSLFERSADGMAMLDEEQFTVIDANQAFRDLLQRDIVGLRGMPFIELIEGAERTRFEHWLSMGMRMGKGRMAAIPLLRADNSMVYADISLTVVTSDDDRVLLFSFKDVSDRIEIERQLADAAQRDELTGLFNKRSFNNRLEGAAALTQRERTPVSLLFIDLDNFKKCNDTFGHQVGDKVLRLVGDAIHKSIRCDGRDQGFRNGGDEFAVLLHGASTDSSMTIAERIRNEFVQHETYGTTMSVGVATFRDGMAVADFVRAADDALYSAKRGGKNSVALAQ